MNMKSQSTPSFFLKALYVTFFTLIMVVTYLPFDLGGSFAKAQTTTWGPLTQSSCVTTDWFREENSNSPQIAPPGSYITSIDYKANTGGNDGVIRFTYCNSGSFNLPQSNCGWVGWFRKEQTSSSISPSPQYAPLGSYIAGIGYIAKTGGQDGKMNFYACQGGATNDLKQNFCAWTPWFRQEARNSPQSLPTGAYVAGIDYKSNTGGSDGVMRYNYCSSDPKASAAYIYDLTNDGNIFMLPGTSATNIITSTFKLVSNPTVQAVLDFVVSNTYSSVNTTEFSISPLTFSESVALADNTPKSVTESLAISTINNTLPGTYVVTAAATPNGSATTLPPPQVTNFEVRVTGEPPSGLTVSNDPCVEGSVISSITLRWSAPNNTNVIGYEVYRSGRTLPLATLSISDGRTYTDDFSDLSPLPLKNTSFNYLVIALYPEVKSAPIGIPATVSECINILQPGQSISFTAKNAGSTDPVVATGAGVTMEVPINTTTNLDWDIKGMDRCALPSGKALAEWTQVSNKPDENGTQKAGGTVTYATVTQTGAPHILQIACYPTSTSRAVLRIINIKVTDNNNDNPPPLTCAPMPAHASTCSSPGGSVIFDYNPIPPAPVNSPRINVVDSCPTSGGPYYCTYKCDTARGYYKKGNICVMSGIEEF